MCSIETSESIKAISAALGQFQAKTHGVKRDSENPFHKSRYASLEAVIETAKPALKECGLVFMQAPGLAEHGTMAVSTLIMHPASGEWIRSTASTPLAKQDPQGVGSAITYLCRYALMASLGLPALDDDAEATKHQPEHRRAPEPSNAAPKGNGQVYSPSRKVYVENSVKRIAGFDSAVALLSWAKTERQDVWPQFDIDPMDEDGQRIVRVYKARMSELGSPVGA